MDNFVITRDSRHSAARTGELATRHGTVPTPAFCPVGSQATVKTLTPEEVSATGAGMILSNTYHLYLRPGIELIAQVGGLHRFMGWHNPILTDSGGFQIFSLSPLAKITDEGVTFRSHIDGSKHHITPENVIDFQQALGSDIMMVLDEVPHPDAHPLKIARAVERTTDWAQRCLKARTATGQQLFAIIQGGTDCELRRKSAESLTGLEFDGFALGGLSLGEAKRDTWHMLDITVPLIPETKPRYLMGVGSPEDLVEAVSRGIDIFDSVLPTRVARNGGLYTAGGRINIKNSRFQSLDGPVEEGCSCYTCRNFSAGYLAHLFRSGEILGLRLASIHNLSFLQTLMAGIRQSIRQSYFEQFRSEFLAGYRAVDEQTRTLQKQKWLENRLNKL
ncbi:MAG: tRNA guanosine(34) transglycosylase Tgt [Dehalococcoidaceae bacterium]|nr:tRNA guanosine(34) transglycosylase Tgt [Dehalococcoidaceae bacterium]